MIKRYHPRKKTGNRSVHRIARKPRGMALIMVLGALVLISVLLLGFLTSVRQDRGASAFYESGTTTRQYAETAASIVITQISEATKDPALAWISQPGLVRTFNSSGAVAAYKLYSSDTMKVTGAYNPATSLATEVPTSWYTEANVDDKYVDLNKPVFKDGANLYPIADPTAITDVEGFSIASGLPAPSDTANKYYNALPMPVRWVYIMKDGSITSYTVALASPLNVVARVGFWADDETCKVNVNTASDGVFYDSPAYFTRQDYIFGVTQPVAQEYQRFPGHPATTSLAAVIKSLRDIPLDDLVIKGLDGNAIGTGSWTSGNLPTYSGGPKVNATRAQAATKITPRISPFRYPPSGATSSTILDNGGSNGGRGMAWLDKNPVIPDSDPIFSTIDEVAFQRDALSKSMLNTSTTPAARYLSPVSPKKLAFFLTTDSRAPELNLLNRPRITLWPFNKDILTGPAGASDWSRLTPEDRLLRFSSELGSNKRKLYFQREDAWDPAHDYSAIAENRSLYAYLQWSTAQSMPTANTARATSSDTLQNKYTALGRDQILTSMFDYLRSMVNVFNYSYEPVGGAVYTFPQNHYPNGDGIMIAGYSDITPLGFDGGNGATKGIGSGGPVINEILFQIYNAGEYLMGQSFSNTYGAATTPNRASSITYGAISGTATDALTWNDDGSVTNSADLKPDYVVRRIQLVCLLDLMSTNNNLNAKAQRMQVRISGTGFGFSVAAWNTSQGITNESRKIKLRFKGQTDSDWVETLSNIGFPVAEGSAELKSTLICAEGGDDGGMYGIAWPMMFPRVSGLQDPRNSTQTKTFVRSLSDATVLTRSLLGGAVRYYDLGPISAAQSTYQVYPFISDVVEVRIPYPNASSNTESPYTITDTNGATVLTPTTEPTLTLTGNSDFTLKTFPGLKADPPNYTYPDISNFQNAPTFSVWDVESGSTPVLTSTTFAVATCTVPLPILLGKAPMTDPLPQQGQYYRAANNSWQIPRYGIFNPYTGWESPPQWANNTVHFLPSAAPLANWEMVTMKEGQFYPQRFWVWYKDYILALPRNDYSTRWSDVVRAYHLTGSNGAYGDYRLAATAASLPSSSWGSSTSYSSPTTFFSAGSLIPTDTSLYGSWWSVNPTFGRLLYNRNFTDQANRITANNLNGVTRKTTGGSISAATSSAIGVGDFSVGYGNFPGGGAIVGPDVGAIVMNLGGNNVLDADAATNDNPGPYYAGDVSRASSEDDLAGAGDRYHQNFLGIVFSPWKQMPSAINFGTIPSRSTEATPAPWETLLFCPNPNGGASTHRGWSQLPRDHYWLDLFYMPVVEPYAITENYATNGKINLNYQIAPFTYITRQTGLYALLRNMQIPAVPDNDSGSYKSGQGSKYFQAAAATRYRWDINMTETLLGFASRFTSNDPFVSASEVTEMFLVPNDTSSTQDTLATISTYWADKNLTGDDKKESVYNHIYPRVTTRSNTYKVHFTAQSLTYKNSRFQVMGQYRGSQTIERYLDINNRLYGSASGTASSVNAGTTYFPALAGDGPDGFPYYRFRTINQTHFAP